MKYIKYIFITILLIYSTITSVTFGEITHSAPRLTVIISVNGLDNYEIEAFSKM